MHFDWYQATIEAHPMALLDAVKSDAGDQADRVDHGNGRHNYANSSRLLDLEGGRIVEVLHGGSNGTPNLAASGIYAGPVSETVRRLWPVHRVSRVDVCEDMVGDGLFDHLEGVCRTIGRQFRIKGTTILPDDPADGSTYYLAVSYTHLTLPTKRIV